MSSSKSIGADGGADDGGDGGCSADDGGADDGGADDEIGRAHV
jgi:hypothetical protein